ncbi:MAG: hypothetical protein LBR42_03010 [Candidatus Methanoplasma sp.]|nr:hypothetical protein [Candidatus Methanoplasma sp.]
MALPCRVEPGSAAMEYNNGILEVTLASADASASSNP